MERSELIQEIKNRLDVIEREAAELRKVVEELEESEEIEELEEIKEIKELEESPIPSIPSIPSIPNIPKKIDARLISDLRKAIGLNDRIRFQKELFCGDVALMNSTIDALNGVSSYAEALEYLAQNFTWDEENDTVKYFKDILNRKVY